MITEIRNMENRKHLENTASMMVPYFAVDSCGSLSICKFNFSKRKVVIRSDFLSAKLMLKLPAKISGDLCEFLPSIFDPSSLYSNKLR